MTLQAVYVSFDAALSPLGRSQVVPYVKGLAKVGVSMSLITVEDPSTVDAQARLARELDELGIAWLRLPGRVGKPWSQVRAQVAVTWTALRQVRSRRADILHARSYRAALVGLVVRRMLGCKLLFDMRGFFADERAEGGVWRREGLLYRSTKALEPILFRNSDEVVSLTEAGRRQLESLPALKGRLPPVTVVPTCVDLDRFRPGVAPLRPELGGPHSFVLAYSGSVGTWYLLPQMLGFFKTLRRRIAGAHLLLLVNNDPEIVRRELSDAGIEPSATTVHQASPDEVPGELAVASAAIFFIRPTFSKTASCPTKLAEALASGIPVVANRGVGDVDSVVETNQVGVLVDSFDDESLDQAAVRLISLVGHETSVRCRRTAESLFALEDGVRAYRDIYERIVRG